MIKCNLKEKNQIEGLCDVVLKAGGLRFHKAVKDLLALVVVEKGRMEKKSPLPRKHLKKVRK